MPKSGGSGKKLSKSEKEKLKKEEEAKRAQEEEEAKLLAEKEAAADEERLKEESEERRKLENEHMEILARERKRRQGELTELEEIWNSIQTELQNNDNNRRIKAKWDRYMLCDGSPDPTIPGEINTYMNLWRENTENNSIQDVLKDSELTLKLIAELEFLLTDTPRDELTDLEAQRYKETVLELQLLLKEKLNLAAHDMFLKTTDLADAETGNLQHTVGNDVITLCTWGNLSKNTRLKSHEFEELGFKFDIPRVLALADCGVCMLFTRFDHLSPYSRTYRSRIKTKGEEKPAETTDEDNDNTEGKTEGGEEKDGEEGGGEGEEGGENLEGESKDADGGEDDLNRETTEDLMATLHGDPKPADDTEETEAVPEAEPMEEDYEIKTPELIDYEDFDGDEEAVDLRSYSVLGGIYNFSLINMPPQPKIANSWSMTIVSDPARMDPMEYLADSAVIIPTESKENKEENEEEQDSTEEKKTEEKKPSTPGGEEKPKKDDRPLLAVVIRLPKDVYFCEEPQVVRWDEDAKLWSLSGFSDNYYNEGYFSAVDKQRENRVLSFKTTHFSTLALIQDTHINMPFQSWEFRPHSLNSAVFTVIATIVEMEIEIKTGSAKFFQTIGKYFDKDGLCMYTVNDDKPELFHLKDKWMPAVDLIKALKAAGMNIFPSEDSHKYVSIQDKNRITEDRLYEQMSLTASCMAYSWSKWNSEIKDHEKIVFQGAEHLQDEPLLEEDWSLYLITKKRTTKLKMTEFDSPFSEDHAEGTEFHADLYHMTKDISSEESVNRMNATSTEYINTVHTLLNATRVITYS